MYFNIFKEEGNEKMAFILIFHAISLKKSGTTTGKVR
jgi:hypothetical protein